MTFDFQQVLESKRALRQRLAALPIADKLRLLDNMRGRAIAIRAAKRPRTSTVQEQDPHYGKHS
jgi:hypothetical protein